MEPNGFLSQDAIRLSNPRSPVRLMLGRSPAFRATSWCWRVKAGRERVQKLKTRVRIYRRPASSTTWRVRLYEELHRERAVDNRARHAAAGVALVDERIKIGLDLSSWRES